jgi:hypothetical protein
MVDSGTLKGLLCTFIRMKAEVQIGVESTTLTHYLKNSVSS